MRSDLSSDMVALLHAEASYAPTYDGKHGEEWASLFTEDGIYQARVVNGKGGNFISGRANLVRFCNEQPWHGIHHMMIPKFEVDGGAATCRVNFQYRAIGIVDEQVSIRNSSGTYDVAYVRSGSGWLMRRRVTSFFAESMETYYGRYPAVADLTEAWPYGDARYVDRRT